MIATFGQRTALAAPLPFGLPARLVALCLLAARACALTFTPAPPSLQVEEHALLEGEADRADRELREVLRKDPANGPADLLLCRVYVSEGRGSDAAAACQAALDHGLSRDSNAQDWTGRALGLQASQAGMISGLKLALQVRTAFETAVSLNQASEAACVDLGEFYVAAPAIVGGGTAKALALATRIAASLPETAHRIRAMAAEKNKDLPTAEAEFKAEAAVAHRAGSLVDLAAFYGRHGDNTKAISTSESTIQADRSTDATVVEAAGVLADAGQLPAAETALRAYLEHGEHSDRAPVFRVRTTLGNLLQRSGQRDAARGQYEAALTLASSYGPARKGLASL